MPRTDRFLLAGRRPRGSQALDNVGGRVAILPVKSTYSIDEAQSQFLRLVREAEKGGTMAAVTRHERPVAYVMGADELAALIETAATLGNPAAMKAIGDAESGRGRMYSIDQIGR